MLTMRLMKMRMRMRTGREVMTTLCSFLPMLVVVTFYLTLGFAFIPTASGTSNDIIGCGGFVKSIVNINYSRVALKLYTLTGSLKYATDCAPNNGYYFIPLEGMKGDYVLKIEPPELWTFEPKQVTLKVDGLTDPCSLNHDINFVFRGFTVTGKVLSKGLTSGPAAVSVTLKAKQTNNILKTTQSNANGEYKFEEVLPGEYQLEAAHPVWRFVGSSTVDVILTDDNVHLENDARKVITVAGYDVSGKVLSEGEPIKGVQFALYSKSKAAAGHLADCDAAEVPFKTAPPGNLKYLCQVSSGVEGTFGFPVVPPGDYRLVPFYKGKNIQFDVKPGHVDFKVEHESVRIETLFNVEGFSVTGKVMTRKNGPGIVGAEVLLTDDKGTGSGKIMKTGANGIFHLENMRTGVYRLQITADHILFETVSVKISPATPQLPHIYASAFEVCGNFLFVGSSSESEVQVKITKTDAGRSDEQLVEAESDGRFCTFLKSGSYRIKPMLDPSSELVFTPNELIPRVTDFPILDLEFNQFTARISGDIAAKKKEKDITIHLERKDTQELVQSWKSSGSSADKFAFEAVLPGKYRLRVEKERNTWCWENDFVDVEVNNKDISGLVFAQKGFIMSFYLSHPVRLRVEYPDKKKVEELDVVRAKVPFKHCVGQSGTYTITPISCHKFKPEEAGTESLLFDTESPTLMTLQALKHRVKALVKSNVNVSDLMVSIRLKSNAGGQEEQQKVYLQQSNSYIDAKDRGQVVYEYPLSLWVGSWVSLILEPSSSQLLFKPSSAEIKVEDDCVDNGATFKGRTGLFINGFIKPKLEGVQIVITDKGDESLVLFRATTDSWGKYVAGPFDCESDDERECLLVSASKDGYVFQPLWDKKSKKKDLLVGHFEAKKLASVVVKLMVSDPKSKGSAVPLKEVLISLSGGSDNYRKNLVTPDAGELTFLGLNPGQYFLRAVLKEYQFEPSSQMFDVKEGETVSIVVKGNRVAFSCLGITDSLNGEPEVGVIVEAVGVREEGQEQGLKDCHQLHEEAVSEADGSFRIRALKPKCKYLIRLKGNDERNKLFLRTVPVKRLVQVIDGDVTGNRLIVFRKPSQMDVTGDVLTSDPNHLNSLKVVLFPEVNPDSPLATLSLSSASAFFSLPLLPIDNRVYVVRLESTLSAHLYDYNSQSITFTTNSSFYHFQFKFYPRLKVSGFSGLGASFVDQDSTYGGNVYTLPLLLLITIIIYNYSKVMPLVTSLVDNVQNLIPNGNETFPASGDPSAAAKRKVKPRRT